MASFQAPGQRAAAPAPDLKVPSPPADGISSVTFASNNLLAASSWDGGVRVWQVQQQMNQVAAAPAVDLKHDGPALCTAFNADGSTLFAGGADAEGLVKMWQLGQPTPQTVGKHDGVICKIFYVPELNTVVTGSWDRTVRFWDLRQPNPVATVPLPERVYAMDIKYPMMVVGTAEVAKEARTNNLPERPLYTFNLHNFNGQPHSINPSPHRHQSRCISIFPDTTGFAIGTIEGRVSIEYVDPGRKKSSSFSFKCHRFHIEKVQPPTHEVYAVNAISFHPFGTFATCGSDGMFNFWDKDSRQRLKHFPRCAQPIPCGNFNHDGSLYAYAVSYDWSKGRQYLVQGAPNDICVHVVEKSEISPRKRENRPNAGRR